MVIKLSRLAQRGASIVQGDFFKVATQVTSKGTRVHNVFDESGNFLTKVVLPGVKNKSAKFDAMSADYLRGRAMHVLAQTDGRIATTYRYSESNECLRKANVFRAGEFNIPTRELPYGGYPGSVRMESCDSMHGLNLYDNDGFLVCNLTKCRKPPEGHILNKLSSFEADDRVYSGHMFVNHELLRASMGPKDIGLASSGLDGTMSRYDWFA